MKRRTAVELRDQLRSLQHLERISAVCASEKLKAWRPAVEAAERELEERLRVRQAMWAGSRSGRGNR